MPSWSSSISPRDGVSTLLSLDPPFLLGSCLCAKLFRKILSALLIKSGSSSISPMDESLSYGGSTLLSSDWSPFNLLSSVSNLILFAISSPEDSSSSGKCSYRLLLMSRTGRDASARNSLISSKSVNSLLRSSSLISGIVSLVIIVITPISTDISLMCSLNSVTICPCVVVLSLENTALYAGIKIGGLSICNKYSGITGTATSFCNLYLLILLMAAGYCFLCVLLILGTIPVFNIDMASFSNGFVTS